MQVLRFCPLNRLLSIDRIYFKMLINRRFNGQISPWHGSSVVSNMNFVLQTLLKLQALEFGGETGKAVESQIAEFRTQVPPPILGHYDRLRARDKKGVAVVRNQTCTGCYMRQPIGKITVLMRNEDIQLCDSCGRYLYLPTEGESTFVDHVAATKPAEKPAKQAKPRKKRTVSPVPAA